jgi:hypothetical protein
VTCAGVWLLYALTSTATSGACLSIRWFVPMLAPGYYLIAVYLKHQPERLVELLVLSGWGTVQMALVGRQPWLKGNVPFYWYTVGAAVGSWIGVRVWIEMRKVRDVRAVFRPRLYLPTPDVRPVAAMAQDVRERRAA